MVSFGALLTHVARTAVVCKRKSAEHFTRVAHQYHHMNMMLGSHKYRTVDRRALNYSVCREVNKIIRYSSCVPQYFFCFCICCYCLARCTFAHIKHTTDIYLSVRGRAPTIMLVVESSLSLTHKHTHIHALPAMVIAARHYYCGFCSLFLFPGELSPPYSLFLFPGELSPPYSLSSHVYPEHFGPRDLRNKQISLTPCTLHPADDLTMSHR